ncbi:Dedicator of cytokinesis family protein [Trichomonas vaginalis G3]|uniref:Dedicator of cytokinesis family protein n=1 Tax=Trichomonas vaginalis (strain ATCC PRA-98 / G3) TaxID=412133 RepID=A2EY35_TRIV3|nr:dedicator of cytokinesis DOCK family [Trichomonas vaginalis G3]EAY02445.1 Dedicator of cytokinesis family protein [Trichomonas vaginalis G3]KAI5527860.1 dedicator of cytokinesis DOCK family [Trichomonas vaginalis G3]|eukprot:XP_001330685.1 Dedicator of cytokinesis family protein [Trichomonas vaginalis G3]
MEGFISSSPAELTTPIVNFKKDIENPFLTDDFRGSIKSHPDPNPTTDLFCKPGLEMSIVVPDNTPVIPQNKLTNLSTMFSNHTSSTASFDTPFSCIDSNDLFAKADAKPNEFPIGEYCQLTIQFDTVEAAFEDVEPVIITSFLYSLDSKKIISNSWKFSPKGSVGILQANRIPFSFKNVATFQIDPLLKTENIYFMILLSHPTTVENSTEIIKYYNTPNAQTRAVAQAHLKTTFPRVNNSYSQFAFGFMELNSIINGDDKFKLSKIYYVDNIDRDNIFEKIQECVQGKGKMMPININFIKLHSVENIIRPKVLAKPQPFLAPNHQVFVSLKSANIKSNARNILIKMTIRDTQHSRELPLLCNPLSQDALDTAVYSHCVYHEKAPKFIDDFIVDLPFPVQQEAYLVFEIFHVHAKVSDKSDTHIGTGSFKLIDKGTIQTGRHIEIPITLNGEKDKSSKVEISIKNNSCYQSDNANMNKLLNEKDLEKYIPLLSPELIITNLTSILNIFLEKMEEKSDDFNIDLLAKIQEASDTCSNVQSFTKYLAIFTKYFALKQKNPFRGVRKETNIQLTDFSNVNNSACATVLSTPTSLGNPDDLLDAFLSCPPSNLVPVSNSFPVQQDLLNMTEKKDLNNVHNKLIKGLNNYLNKNELKNIILFTDFIFSSIIKSMATTNVVDFDSFGDMCTSFCSAAIQVRRGEWKPTLSYSLFCQMLFDLGFFNEASLGIETMLKILTSNNVINDSLCSFICFTLKPSFFYITIANHINFKKEFNNMIKFLLGHKDQKINHIIRRVCRGIIKCCQTYEPKVAREVSDCLLPILIDLNTNALPPMNEVYSLLSLFIFILNNMTERGLQDPSINRLSLYEVAHYLLNHINEKLFTKNKSKPKPDLQCSSKTIRNDMFSLPPQIPQIKKNRSQTDLKKLSIDGGSSATDNDDDLISFKEENIDPLNELHSAILSFMRVCVGSPVGDVKPDGLINLVFHMCCSNLTLANFDRLCSMTKYIFDKFSPVIFNCSTPPIARLLHCFFIVSTKNYNKLDTVGGLFVSLFNNDLEKCHNNNRSAVIAMRFVSLLTHQEIIKEEVGSFLEKMSTSSNNALRNFALTFMKIRKNSMNLTSEQVHFDRVPELMMERVFLFRTCPDHMLTILDEIANYHLNQDMKMEYVYTLILKMAIILEFGVFIGEIPNLFGTKHCASQFLKNLPIAESIYCHDAFINDMPKVPGFCGNPCFSQSGLLGIMISTSEYCQKNQLFDAATYLYDIAMPLLEYSRLYSMCSQFLGIFSGLFRAEAAAPSMNSDVMQDRYFRVILTGKIFGEDENKGYVYHANRLTRVFDISKQIVASYNQIYNGKIDLLQASAGQRDPTMGYINVTFIEPYHDDDDELSVGQVNLTDEFYFDTPFVPNSNKAQGTVETQWIRRTVIKTAQPLPCPLRRVQILPDQEKVIEYEPIKVAYRQIRNRTKSILSAINDCDYLTIQQLLHGSLLAQVNEGPAKIAEVFLQGDSPLRPKMKKEFLLFLDANEKGVKKHAEWVADNQAFVALQVQLEAGMDALREKLTPLLELVQD